MSTLYSKHLLKCMLVAFLLPATHSFAQDSYTLTLNDIQDQSDTP